jgi:membrane associated rhomboid family serine protease
MQQGGSETGKLMGAMSDDVIESDEQTCFHHPNRETGRSCTRCGRPACSDCLRQAAVGSHCFECVKAGQPPRREQLRRWNATHGILATQVLIGINLAVFVLTMGRSGGRLESDLVLFGPAVADGEFYRLVTTGFVHFGIFHVGMNMLLLYQFGQMLEPTLGRVRFSLLFLAGLLSGAFGALLLTPDAFTGGASGAVFGLIGAAAVAMRQRGISLRENGVGALIVINMAFTLLLPNISIGGHVGGLLGGAAVAAIMLTPGRKSAEGIAAAVVVILLALAGSMMVDG